MADAIKCDMTGKLVEGTGVKSIDVDLTPTLRLRVIPLVKTGPNEYAQGVVSDDGAHVIRRAVEVIPHTAAKPTK